jgi:hypothetical protein
MSRPDSISVAWPPTGLGEPGWRTRLECLATRSEALIGKHCRLSDTAGLALELVGLLWPVLGAPETVAATCRASLLVGAPGMVAASSAADQLAEVHSRLDAIWEAAQEDPAAGVVELPPPLLVEIKPVPYELAGKVEPEALVDEVTEPAVEPEPEPQLPVVITEQQWEADPEPDPDELPEAWRSADFGESCLAKDSPFPPGVEPPAPKKRRSKPAPVPPGWWSSDDLADLLNVDSSSVSRWRRAGCLGVDGADWGKFGRVYAFSAELVADLEANGIKQRLQLVASGLSHCL